MVTFATQVKRRRGTAEQNDEFTGAEGEIVVNLTNKSLRVHDGSTKGGFETMRQNMENSVNISNCILEIPQDIKLGLTDGTLTLKAGSKVYVPNGFESDGVTPKFDEITIESDLTATASSNGETLICVQPDGSGLIPRVSAKCVSGTTRSLTDTYMLWYDTENNVVNNYGSDSTTPLRTVSLPIAVVTVSNNAISSISRTFNGFGYIGYTIFALPGVKGVIPNEHNTDGTLSNTVFTVNSVKTIGYAATYNGYTISLSASSIGIWVAGRLVYDEQKNHNINTQDNSVQTITICGKVSCDGTRITSFEPKTVFRAVDYNDTEYMAKQATPSNRYIDFTVGAHGTYYTAPADGWFVIISTNSQVANSSIGLRNTSNEMTNQTFIASTNAIHGASIPVAKGQRAQGYYYGQDINTLTVRFVYAKGAK